MYKNNFILKYHDMKFLGISPPNTISFTFIIIHSSFITSLAFTFPQHNLHSFINERRAALFPSELFTAGCTLPFRWDQSLAPSLKEPSFIRLERLPAVSVTFITGWLGDVRWRWSRDLPERQRRGTKWSLLGWLLPEPHVQKNVIYLFSPQNVLLNSFVHFHSFFLLSFWRYYPFTTPLTVLS